LILVDTSFWFAQLVEDDVDHRRFCAARIVQLRGGVQISGTQMQERRRRRAFDTRIAVRSAGRDAFK